MERIFNACSWFIGADMFIDFLNGTCLRAKFGIIAFEFVFNEVIIGEQRQNFFIFLKAECAQKVRYRHFSCPVDTHSDFIARFRLKFNPRPAIRYYRRRKNIFTRLIHRRIIIHAGTSHQLRNNDSLRPINNKCAGVRHQREIPHKNFLFFYVAEFMINQLHLDSYWRRISTVPLFTFFESVFWLAEYGIFKK